MWNFNFFFLISEKFGLSNAVIIKSYSYSKLVMGYGPDRAATVTVNWDSKEKIYKLILGIFLL